MNSTGGWRVPEGKIMSRGGPSAKEKRFHKFDSTKTKKLNQRQGNGIARPAISKT